jgi:hypothetical protein
MRKVEGAVVTRRGESLGLAKVQIFCELCRVNEMLVFAQMFGFFECLDSSKVS